MMERLFIAITLPETTLAALVTAQDALRRDLEPRAVRWVRPEAMHVTLRFLGDTAPDRADAVRRALAPVAGAYAPLAFRLGRTGAFPNGRRPRVLWAGVIGDVTPLAALKGDIDGALAPLGWAPETRSFTPHITLGRVRQPGREFGRPLPDVAVAPAPFRVTALTLYRSELRPSGPIYTVVGRFPLAAAP